MSKTIHHTSPRDYIYMVVHVDIIFLLSLVFSKDSFSLCVSLLLVLYVSLKCSVSRYVTRLHIPGGVHPLVHYMSLNSMSERRNAKTVYCNDLPRALFIHSSVLNMLMYTCIHLYAADSTLFQAANCSHGIAQITSRLILEGRERSICVSL